MSRQGIATLKELARAVKERDIDFTAPAEEITRALIAVPGIGSWTAQYVALRALAEPDAFLPGDFIVRRALQGSGREAMRRLEARAESWRPWRAYAVIHFWEAQNL
jgi:AraC family transcriptional regulator of adaptative response / DNA-3-methyladenine glycosylase II